MSEQFEKPSGRLLFVVGVVAASLLAFAATMVVFVQQNRAAIERDRQLAQAVGSQYGRRLEEQLDHALSAAYALSAVVRERRGVPEEFSRLAAELLAVYPALGSLQLAPGGVIRHIFPLAGHEAALNHDLLADKQRNKEAMAAIESRRMTLAGPFELRQGGIAVIGRLPIFLAAERRPTELYRSDDFWGFATSVVFVSNLLRSTAFREIRDHGYAYVLWRQHPDTGARQVIDASEAERLSDPVRIDVRVPNGVWRLDLSPRQGGWQGIGGEGWALAITLSSLAGVLVFMFLRWPARLSAEVARKTWALRQSEDKFRTVADFTYDWEYWTDPEGNVVYMSPSVERLTGYSVKDFSEDPGLIDSLVHEDDADLWRQHRAKHLSCERDTGAARVEFRIRTRDGAVRWLHHVCQPVFSSDGICRGCRASNRDITERRAAEAALGQQHAFNRALLDAQSEADIGFVIVEGGRIAYANEAIGRLYGYTVEELLGQESFLVLAHPDEREAILANHRRCLRGEKFESRFDFRFLRKNGSSGTVELSMATIPRAGRKEPAVFCVLIDVSQRTRFEAELLAAKQDAESANQAKSSFLANMSHELRTPMHAVLSFAEMGELKAGSAEPEKLRSFFHRIRVSGQRLLGLLDDLLDLAKLESGKMVFDFRPQDLKPLVRDVIVEFGSLAAERQLALRFEPGDGASVAEVDASRFVQIVRNFLSNAIKFTPQGGIIEVRLRPAEIADAGDPAIALEVSDSGIGIPEDELESIFDKFVQSSKTRSGSGGTGLGLAICREIAEAHRGRIFARNNLAIGATLTLIVPLATPRADKEE